MRQRVERGVVIGLMMVGAAIVATAVGFVGGAAAGAGVAPASPQVGMQAEGNAIYEQRCSSCHQPGGIGLAGTFPPLAGNANAADPAYVDDVIRNGLSGPIEVDGVVYDAAMAAVDLSDDERAAVVDYVVGLAAAAPAEDTAAAESTAVQALVGDVDSGRRLFVGSTSFEERGAACSSCHEAGDVGHRGGSSLGPDLDTSIADFGGEAGLSAWLAAPTSATMQPVFADRPLTEQEIADLVTFMETAPDRTPPRTFGDGLLLGAALGLAVLLGGMALARRTMSQSYSQRLRSKS